MQVYVITAQISADSDTPIVATYADGVTLDPGVHPNTSIFTIPDATAATNVVKRPPGMRVLTSAWRNDLEYVINAEAQRRILISFPEYAQRNANSFTIDRTLKYGTDSTTWPTSDQTELAECNRGWTFANDVRTASNTLLPLAPLNPADDSHWPAQLSPPIQLQPF
jgi:hypothetical protein